MTLIKSMINSLLALILFAGICGSAGAADFCERLPLDPEFPAGLTGSYQIVGKQASAADAYAGTLAIGYGKNNYALTRTIHGHEIHGDGWIERCGADKITTLVVKYHAKPALGMQCALGADGNNYYRISCKMHQDGSQQYGIEAWFQEP